MDGQLDIIEETFHFMISKISINVYMSLCLFYFRIW